jgi:LacI family transcriptional regulator
MFWIGNKMASSKNATINDVAAAAGVSRATVSRALAGYGRISKETVNHVRAVAEDLGYRPNALAVAMRAGRTKTIGLVVISDFTNAFFDRATKSIIDRAKELGYRVLIQHSDEDVSVERVAVETMLANQVDGIILVPASKTQHSHLTPKKLSGKPLVIIDRKLDVRRFTTVTTGDELAAKEAVLFTAELGHKRMGFLIAVPGTVGFTSQEPNIPITSVQERIDGFAAGVKAAKASGLWIYSEDKEEVAGSAVEKMLDSPKAPSVIFTSNNDMLLAVLKVVGERGLAIGKDISVVSFDDSPWAAAMVPGITVIARPVEELGAIAVTELIETIEGNAKPKEIVLPARLIRRGSVARLTKAQ